MGPGVLAHGEGSLDALIADGEGAWATPGPPGKRRLGDAQADHLLRAVPMPFGPVEEDASQPLRHFLLHELTRLATELFRSQTPFFVWPTSPAVCPSEAEVGELVYNFPSDDKLDSSPFFD
jgi:hypothetical protein